MKNNYLLGCDWGTTTFRLRLIHLPDQALVGEVQTQDGIFSTYDSWKSADPDQVDRQQFFVQRISRQVKALAAQTRCNLDGIPVLISGMASSSIGMQEVPYATLPFPLNGSQIAMQYLKSSAEFPHEIMLISGVRSSHDVMRGEEIQLIGLVDMLHLPESAEAVLIFPGTHSKHLLIQNHQLTHLQTFMTGELFSILSSHSILKDSLEVPGFTDLSERDREAFGKGVGLAESAGLIRSLFSVRTNQLFQKLDKRENAFFLSGLLIGSELSYLKNEVDRKLLVCTTNYLHELYDLALQVLDISDRTLDVPAEKIGRATIAGQVKVFRNQYQAFNY